MKHKHTHTKGAEKSTNNQLEITKEKISEEELKKIWNLLNPEACKKRAEDTEKFAKELFRQFAILKGIKFNEKDIDNH